MKKYIIIGLALAMVVFSACDPKTFDPVLSIGDASTITSPAAGTAYVFTETNTDEIITFSWTETDYGFQSGTSYTLQVDQAGNDFANASTLTTTTESTVDLTYAQVNNALIASGLPGNTPFSLEFRVASDISDEVETVYSAPITLDMTLFAVEIIYPRLTVPGAYQGWDAEDSVNVVYDRKLNDRYEGYINLGTSEFKFTDGNGWAVNWGDNGSDGTLDTGGDNIAAPGDGIHRVNVDLSANTYSVVPTSWGIIGDATPTGWDSDTDMVYDEASRALSVTIDLVPGSIKFRANDDWVVNFGDTFANGTLEYDGDNIAISEAGNYTVELRLGDSDYVYSITKN
ncbi:MAG: SusE domain-containing protein [Bacteroidota bacterium]